MDRTRPEQEEQRVSTIELFFDLVFVFTLTQLTFLLEHDVTVEAAARVLLLFVVMFWMYGGYVWLTNQVPPTRTPARLLLIAGMAAFFVCALAVPGAFEDTGVEFGIGYLLVVLVHGGLYAERHGRAVLRFVPANIVGALLLIVAGVVGGAVAYVLWVAVIALQRAAAWAAGRVDEEHRAGFDIEPGHFVERHGLLLLVAFGESIVAVGSGVGENGSDPAVVAAAVLGLALSSALWWVYFDADDEAAKTALAAGPLNTRVRRALLAYYYAFIPMLLGIVVAAAGVGLVIGHLGEHLTVGPALLLGGGVGLYLAGDGLFRRTVRIGPARFRVAAAVVATATLVVGVLTTGVVQLAVLVAVVVGMLLAEGRWTTRAAG